MLLQPHHQFHCIDQCKRFPGKHLAAQNPCSCRCFQGKETSDTASHLGGGGGGNCLEGAAHGLLLQDSPRTDRGTVFSVIPDADCELPEALEGIAAAWFNVGGGAPKVLAALDGRLVALEAAASLELDWSQMGTVGVDHPFEPARHCMAKGLRALTAKRGLPSLRHGCIRERTPIYAPEPAAALAVL